MQRNWDGISSDFSDSQSQQTDSETDTKSSAQRTFSRKFSGEAGTFKKLTLPDVIAKEGLKATIPPHVLIVEDTDMCATVIAMMLSKLGCSSDHAENGAEAVEMLRNADPSLYSLVLMDLRMPVMDGFEATRAIKQDLKMSLPVVALSADETFDTREKCAMIGFDDFFSKPLKFEALVTMLEKQIGHIVSSLE